MKAEKMSVFQAGEPNEAFKEYFVGHSYLNMLSTERHRTPGSSIWL